MATCRWSIAVSSTLKARSLLNRNGKRQPIFAKAVPPCNKRENGAGLIRLGRTSTRNFPNRLGKNSNVYLGSAELAAICSKLGRIPTREEYMVEMGVLTAASDKVYRYLNFDKIADFKEVADSVPA